MVPSHYLNQSWNIVNWITKNKVQWNLKQNANIFIQENVIENVVWKIATILSRPQCVNGSLALWVSLIKNWSGFQLTNGNYRMSLINTMLLYWAPLSEKYIKHISTQHWGLNKMADIEQMTSPDMINGLVQERCNSIANALDLHLSCTNPSMSAIICITTADLAPNRQQAITHNHWCHRSLTSSAVKELTNKEGNE